MKQFLKSITAAAVMAVGIAGVGTGAGCDLNINGGRSRPVVYSESSPQSYWGYDGRVYGRHGGDFYVYEGNRRGPVVRDRNIVVRIQRDGVQHRDYVEADKGRHDKKNKRD